MEERIVLHSLVARNCNVSMFGVAYGRQFHSLHTLRRLRRFGQVIGIFILRLNKLLGRIGCSVGILRLFRAKSLAALRPQIWL